MHDNDTVMLQVPQPHYNEDAELNLISMLNFVVSHELHHGTLEEEEVARAVEWLHARYGRNSEAVTNVAG